MGCQAAFSPSPSQLQDVVLGFSHSSYFYFSGNALCRQVTFIKTTFFNIA